MDEMSTLTQPPRASRSSQLSIGSSTAAVSVPDSSMADADSSCLSSDYAEIIVVRHGETAWNADRTIQGHLDVELNDAGRQQAAEVVTDADLRERHLGDLQGLVYHELAKLKPQAHQALLSRETCQEIPVSNLLVLWA